MLKLNKHMRKFLIPLIALATLSLGACNKQKKEIEENTNTPEKSFEHFLQIEEAPMQFYWIYENPHTENKSGTFRAYQKNHIIGNIEVNQDWSVNLNDSKYIKSLTSSELQDLNLGQVWNINATAQNTSNLSNNTFEISSALEVDFDLYDGLNAVNPNQGFVIYFNSQIPEQSENATGTKQVVLYSYNSNYDIHAFASFDVEANKNSLSIYPEDLIAFQQFNTIEVHIFEKEIMNINWFDERGKLYWITKQEFKFPFKI